MGHAGHTSTGCGDMSVKRAWGPAKYISDTGASHNSIYKLGQSCINIMNIPKLNLIRARIDFSLYAPPKDNGL